MDWSELLTFNTQKKLELEYKVVNLSNEGFIQYLSKRAHCSSRRYYVDRRRLCQFNGYRITMETGGAEISEE